MRFGGLAKKEGSSGDRGQASKGKDLGLWNATQRQTLTDS
jgi:hypothetical protein